MTTKFTEEMRIKYMGDYPKRNCPYCWAKGKDIDSVDEYGDFGDELDGKVERRWGCNKCGSSWVEYYSVVDVKGYDYKLGAL
jgi:hypothetical protein